MVIFFGQGRLGNQIFQYAFVKNFLKKNEKLVVINFKEFLNLFDTEDNIVNINNKYFQYMLRFIGIPLLKLLSYIRLVSFCRAEKENVNGVLAENGGYEYKKGLLSVTYIFPGYFQSEKYFKKDIMQSVRIKEEYLNRADEFLSKVPKDAQKIFIHIRRRDYKTHRCFGEIDITLPVYYYNSQIGWFNKNLRNPWFIFLSDDLDYVRENFKWVKNKTISTEDMNVDFSIMALSDGAIMSNGTYAWWGAYFMKDKANVVAPKYWFGFKSKIEFPIGITPSFARIVDSTED